MNNLNMCYSFKLTTREILDPNSIMKLNSQLIQCWMMKPQKNQFKKFDKVKKNSNKRMMIKSEKKKRMMKL